MNGARRPSRFDQVIPSIVERDAVSHHTLEAQGVLRSMGFVSEIYALNHGPGLAGRVHPLAELPRSDRGDQWICYQLSIGSPAALPVLAHPARKIVNYHNITPAALVESWMPSLGDEVRLGRAQLAELSGSVEIGIGDSAFNAAELDSAGYARTAVAPLMVDQANFGHRPDAAKLAALRAAGTEGGADWLFVGQMLPHKSHHDVVKAFACYRRAYDDRARLHLVGRESCPPYAAAVRRLVSELGLDDCVDLAGSVSAGELSSYYEVADVFVCCSGHEGFCVPLLEAMNHRLPIVAYATAAVPETVVDAGILLPEKSPAVVAAAVHQVMDDDRLRTAILDRGASRAASFSLEGAKEAFADAVESVLG